MPLVMKNSEKLWKCIKREKWKEKKTNSNKNSNKINMKSEKIVFLFIF